jgi:ketosteroid isomerase-like protein
MTDVDHRELLSSFARVIRESDWDRLGDYLQPDAVVEYPQSGERFSGLENIRAQFTNYPGGLDQGSTEVDEIIGGPTFALTPMYTVIAVEGSGNRGTAIFRTRYPDGSNWWVINVYELRDGRIARSRNFFAPTFDPPDWRAPYRDNV